MSHDNGASLDDLLSPQYKAYNWLVTSVNTTVSGTKLDISHTEFLQRYGLATLFFSTSGHSWFVNSGWLSSSDVCDWNLIECNGKSMVTVLLLNSNNLRGTIPTELAYVTMLERLDLGDNGLYGPIPTEFGQLIDMEKLSLSGNMLTGTIPSQLSNMVNLELLYLHGNDFSGISIPKEICTLRTNYILNTLWADCIADDDGIKKVVCECCTQCFSDESEYIPHADIGHDVTSPPPATTPTVNVEQTGPPTIADRGIGASALIIKQDNQKLRTFLLGHMNGFQERLDDTTSFAHEAYEWLANDKITDSLNDFRKLQRFGLVTFFLSTSPNDTPWKVVNGWSTSEHECNWYGIYCAVNDTVTTISLPGNNLAGTIPPEIALASIGGKVKRFNLAGNSIGGTIPIQLGTLTHLELLDLRSNDLIGQIPLQLGKLKVLKTLNFGANELLGTMPDEICSLRTTAILDTLIADCDTCNKLCCTECY
jgi:Leucine-rich repeat (LRR) protein